MNIQKLRDELIIDEGVRYKVYLDTKGLPTFGIGHLITKKDPESHELKKQGIRSIAVSRERVEQAFKEDIETCLSDCRKVFHDFDIMLEELQLILANMMFNLGIFKFSEFKKFILSIKASDYRQAAKEMEDSLWYNQVKNRAERLVKRMRALAVCRIVDNVKIKELRV